MALCSECEQFDLQSFRSDRYMQRGYAYEDVKNRAATCNFCDLLHKWFGETPLETENCWIHFELLGRDQKRVRAKNGHGLGVVMIRAFLGVRYTIRFGPSTPFGWSEYPRGQEVLLSACADKDSPAAISGDVFGRFYDRSLPSTIHKIEEWLNQCLQHDHCQRTSSGAERLDPYAAPLPTRCINVGTSEEQMLFLEETGTKFGAFITLSHRWDQDFTKACSTTSSNYQQRLSALESDSLPRVFQDAIEIARQLSVKYLWIDSLCIVQDCPEDKDWINEAPKMGNYYQRSLLTLSAVNSDCLISRYTNFDKPLIRLPYRSLDAKKPKGSFFLFKLDPLNNEYQTLVQKSELQSRAWVFQEYLLSRRIIHFATSTVMFECQTKMPMTYLGETVPEVHENGYAGMMITKRDFQLHPGDSNVYSWCNLVEAYSNLDFTYPQKDRTVALSGLAFEFGAAANLPTKSNTDRKNITGKQGSQYLEGLWMDQAYIGLLWEKAEVGSHKLLARRPTWSWTRIYAPILWNWPKIVKYRKERFTSKKPSFNLSSRTTSPAYTSLRVHDPSPGLDVPDITIMSRLVSVTVDRLLEADEIKLLYEDMIRPRSTDDHYHAIRDRSRSHRLCGWATFDLEEPRSSLQPEESATANDNAPAQSQTNGSHASTPREGTEVRALHISTLRYLDWGFHLGYFFTLPSAFYVLFVRNIHGNVFERIGMGCLFGLEVDKVIKEAEFQEVVLI